jgi:glycosyltransferase involved in cell wall biosynthesis
MAKVLIISYFFPPLSGPGVQRSYNFVKNLPASDWEPVVLTVKDIRYVGRDDNLLQGITEREIFRTETLDPMRILFLLEKGLKKNDKDSFYYKAGNNLRSFSREIFPIDSKIGWLPFAYKKACQICRTQKIDAIFCTMSPYSSGILTYYLSRATGIPYVLDYRDLWRGKPDISYLTAWHKKLSYKWEKKIIKFAGAIIHVTDKSREIFLKMYPSYPPEKVKVIYNGYDSEFFKLSYKPIIENNRITFTFAGHFYGNQSPAKLLQAVKELKSESRLSSSIFFEFIGNYPREIEDLFNDQPWITRTGYLDYKDYIDKLVDSDVLLLFVSEHNSEMILTQKLFEYLAVRRPILGMLPPEGEAADIIRSHRAGIVCSGGELAAIKEGILRMIEILRTGKMNENFDIAENDYSRFERQNQARQLSGILKEVTHE